MSLDDPILAWAGATLAGALLATAHVVLSSPWRWSELDRTSRRRVLRGLAWPLLVHGGAAFLGGALAALLDLGPILVWVAGLAAAAAVRWGTGRLTAPVDRVFRLAKDLEDPGKGPGAKQGILRVVEGLPATTPIGRSVRIAAATSLSNAADYSAARPLLEAVSAADLGAHQQELLWLGLVACRMHTGDVSAARQAFLRLPPLEPGSRHALSRRNADALLLVHEGEPARAVERLAEPGADEPDWARRGRLVALAHARAALGEDVACRQALEALAADHGDEGLRRAARPEGAASARARAMLRDDSAPYRG